LASSKGDTVTVYSKSVLGKLGAEVLFLDEDGKIHKAIAHHDK
jgi:hypothetical protein